MNKRKLANCDKCFFIDSYTTDGEEYCSPDKCPYTPTTENKGGDKGHMPFKEYFASLPAEEQEAAKAEFKKMQYRADQSQICQAQGAACISCDLVNCGDRIYGRRK